MQRVFQNDFLTKSKKKKNTPKKTAICNCEVVSLEWTGSVSGDVMKAKFYWQHKTEDESAISKFHRQKHTYLFAILILALSPP